MARWQVPHLDEARVGSLTAALRLKPLTARVLLGRGLEDPAEVTRFLAPRLGDLRPPDGIADLDRAVARLEAALDRRERIGVFGDYDVDGVTTAAILTTTFRALGADVVPKVASRFSGYGLPPAEIARYAEAGCTVLVTGDCGTSDHEALTAAAERGIDVIVIDHHQVPEGPRAAYALINPHRPDDRFAFKGLASCGVAFYLAAALRTRLRNRQHAGALAFDPRGLLDLVALGTIGDLVPLQAENRILVAAGLRELSARRRPGLRALAKLAELDPAKTLDATDVSFRLTPRLNAPGRLGEAQLSLDLLLAATDEEAQARAAAIEEVNRDRQRIQEEVWQAALVEAASQADAAAIVVGQEGWHPGVVGIVAAKLVERYARPVAVVGFRDGVGRGSLRTTAGFHLHRALIDCSGHLVAYGGHAAAAGVTIQWDCFVAFRAAFVERARIHAETGPASTQAVADASAEIDELDLAQVEELARLGPFGSANAEPLIAMSGLEVKSCRVVGTGHLLLTVGRGGSMLDGIGFGMAARAPAIGSVIDALASPEVDDYRGYRRSRLRFRQITAEGT